MNLDGITPSVSARAVIGANFNRETAERHSEGGIYEPIGRKIQELIMKTDQYIVFVDEFGGVQWAHGPLPQIKEEDYDAVCNKVAELEVRSRFLRLEDGPPPEDISILHENGTQAAMASSSDSKSATDFPTDQHALFSARGLIAEGMARLLDTQSGSPVAAYGILDTADKWITQRSSECSRSWFLGRFGVLGLFAFVAAIALICANVTDLNANAATKPNPDANQTALTNPAQPANPLATVRTPAPDKDNTNIEVPTYVLLLTSTLLGGAGAFVSAALLNRKIPFDATAGKKLHQLEAYMRFGIGLVGGFTIILLIHGGIFLGMLKKHGRGSLAACLVLGLLAGGSELFLPTLLTRFDESLEQKPSQK